MLSITKEHLIDLLSLARQHEINAALALVESEINYTDLIDKLKARLSIEVEIKMGLSVEDKPIEDKPIEKKVITDVNPNR